MQKEGLVIILNNLKLNTSTPWGDVYTSDESIAVSVARSIYQLYGTAFLSPHIWNGTVNYCADSTVGIAKESTNEAVIYVSQDGIRINFTTTDFAHIENASVHVIDLQGKVIVDEQLVSSPTIIPVDGLSQGIYICRLVNDQKVIQTQKIYIN